MYMYIYIRLYVYDALSHNQCLPHTLLYILQITSSGTPFWAPPKRCPHALTFDPNNVYRTISCTLVYKSNQICLCFVWLSMQYISVSLFQYTSPSQHILFAILHIFCFIVSSYLYFAFVWLSMQYI